MDRPGPGPHTYRLDLRAFDPSSNPKIQVEVEKLADVAHVLWLNCGTMLPVSSLMAESALGQVVAYNLSTSTVSVWLEHALLRKATAR